MNETFEETEANICVIAERLADLVWDFEMDPQWWDAYDAAFVALKQREV